MTCLVTARETRSTRFPCSGQILQTDPAGCGAKPLLPEGDRNLSTASAGPCSLTLCSDWGLEGTIILPAARAIPGLGIPLRTQALKVPIPEGLLLASFPYTTLQAWKERAAPKGAGKAFQFLVSGG